MPIAAGDGAPPSRHNRAFQGSGLLVGQSRVNDPLAVVGLVPGDGLFLVECETFVPGRDSRTRFAVARPTMPAPTIARSYMRPER